MKALYVIFVFMIGLSGAMGLSAQVPGTPVLPGVDVYYFHPNERCPIDEAIEENTLKLAKSDFAKEVAAGLLKVRVVNTDEPANDALASKFEINTQALYVVKQTPQGEEKVNLTEFAFANAKTNPTAFMDRLKAEIVKALQP